MIFCKIKKFYNKTNSKNKETMISNLLREEFREWDVENNFIPFSNNPARQLKAEAELKEICDIIFVAVQRGYQITGDTNDFEIALNSVCTSNLLKLKDMVVNEVTGKLKKGKNYQKPNLSRYIRC